MRIVIERKNNHEHIIDKEYKVTYGEYQEKMAKDHTQEIANEYEASINANGFEMDDQDDMNNVEAITNLIPGEYDFDCGDFTYYITITEK